MPDNRTGFIVITYRLDVLRGQKQFAIRAEIAESLCSAKRNKKILYYIISNTYADKDKTKDNQVQIIIGIIKEC